MIRFAKSERINFPLFKTPHTLIASVFASRLDGIEGIQSSPTDPVNLSSSCPYHPSEFDLDGSAPSTPSSSLAGGLSERRSSAADQLAANTSANALLGRSPQATSNPGNPAIGLDDATLASTSDAMEVDQKEAGEEEAGPYHPAKLRSDSRSPSFSLTSSRRSSSSRSSSRGNNASDSRGAVREEQAIGNDNEQALEDDEESRDPESEF